MNVLVGIKDKTSKSIYHKHNSISNSTQSIVSKKPEIIFNFVSIQNCINSDNISILFMYFRYQRQNIKTITNPSWMQFYLIEVILDKFDYMSLKLMDI